MVLTVTSFALDKINFLKGEILTYKYFFLSVDFYLIHTFILYISIPIISLFSGSILFVTLCGTAETFPTSP